MNSKRLISILLSICIMLTLMTFPAMAATSGTCGDNLTWTLDDNGTLTILGTGAMNNYAYSSFAPWYNNRSSIKKVVIEQGVTTIGNYAFEGCASLTSVIIPDSVTTIGNYAFEGCASLTSITIPDSVTTIGNAAFINCSSLTSITIPDSVTTIGYNAFSWCWKLTSITVDAENQNYSSQDGVLFNKDKTTIGCYPAGKTVTTYTIPDSVTTIGGCAFDYCTSLTSVTIPDSVTTIGDYAFHSCSSLTSVTIPDSVTTIGNAAFSSCDSLADVYYVGTKAQKNAISIGYNNTPLTSATWHYFDGVCDATCSDCDFVREGGTDHTYTNACDNSCNECGDIRAVGDHVYDNQYDAVCNVCGDVREVDNTNAPTFVAESKSARVGEMFTVAISTKNNSGITSLKLKVGYDANLLELVSIEGKDFDSPHFGPITKNPVTINWEDVLSPNNTTNGAVAVLTFKVKESATEGDTTITITYDPEDVYDENYDNVAFAVEEGIISIIEYIPGDVNGDGTVNNKDMGILRQYLNGWDVTLK